MTESAPAGRGLDDWIDDVMSLNHDITMAGALAAMGDCVCKAKALLQIPQQAPELVQASRLAYTAETAESMLDRADALLGVVRAGVSRRVVARGETS